ncbi:peptide-methionine (S)-S-oxide reductase MsrA [Acetobacter oeni]|nr:peptide-methionine (S)-S-oxide reductase MsrA [Acetobacter oeni]MBB3881937.1 peptide-methionine (S)-S-oxide reductase [Acetobacter oeni]NHO17742.1 peptide-methionine (S)-S-oxide reductase MsrA [Acetobacter oeni]
MTTTQAPHTETAILGAGCFWCVEAVYLSIKGVHSVRSGYAGGHTEHPTYKQVCTGTTGHAEVVEVTFDPAIISYAQLLRIFFTLHDPTTLNRQGNDVGTQYRSVIFFTDEAQQKTALEIRDEIGKSGLWNAPLVTLIKPLTILWPAEISHENYFAQNPGNPYCQAVVAPKVLKMRKAFAELQK